MKKLIIFMFSIVILGSCDKEIEGCTDVNATNYNSEATVDDGSCIIIGCTDPNAINYNPDAVEDSGNCLFTSDGTWEMVSWIQNGNNITQNYEEFIFHCYSDSTWVCYTLPLNWNGNNYANYRGTYFLNNNHTECTYSTTHLNFNDGNGWVDSGPGIRTATYSMAVTHSTLSGSLISSTDTTLNSLDFNYVRVE
jgi:hypothetical protein